MRLRLLPLALGLCASALAAPLDPSRYPASAELVLANLPAEVQPLRSARIKSPVEGALMIHLPAPGTRLAEGVVWGEFEPERLRLETEAVSLARALLAEKESPRLRLELHRAAAQLVERRAELARQATLLARIAQDPALAELYATEEPVAPATMPAAISATASATVSPAGPAPALLATHPPAASDELAVLADRLQAQLSLVDDVLRFSGTAREDQLEQRALALKLKAQELDLARRMRDLRLAMPFEGEVSLLVPGPADGKPLRIGLGEDLAVIQDFSALQARVPVRRPEWRILPHDRLQLRYTRARPVLSARFERSVVQERMGREELVYFFRFPDTARDTARALVGGQISMQLVLLLDQPALIIPKIDLILAAPSGFRDGGWDSAIDQALPGARLLAQGETHLAILAPSSKDTRP